MAWNTRKFFFPGVHYLCSFLILSTVLPSSNVFSLKINSFGGYEDLVVSVSNDVPQAFCSQLVQSIRDSFTSASDYLHTVTEGRVYFHRLTVILPASWDTRTCGTHLGASYTSASTVTNAAVFVGLDHPVFGSVPFTQQSQGCGMGGDFISLSYKFFLPHNFTVLETEYPERLIVHEWSKFRYGLFEERGFKNDPVYPESYKDSDTSDPQPNFCSDVRLQGSWSDSCPNGNGEMCSFTLSNNENVTSSLMSLPALPQVNSFCKENNHNDLAPSKHNFMCSGKSVWDVMGSHPDFLNYTRFRQTRRITPDIVLKQLTPPRFVLVIEETANMNLRDVWKFLKLVTRKFIKYDLETGTQVGIIAVGTDIVRVLANMTTLRDSVRGTLAEKISNYPNIDGISGALSLRKGMSFAVNMLKRNGARVAGSVIILVSQGTTSKIDLDASLDLLKKEEVSVATIEYPSTGDGRISKLAHATYSPDFAIRETGVGSVSHISTYIQLVNAFSQIRKYFTRETANNVPALVHQKEFKGDAPGFVNGSFFFDSNQSPGQFHIYIPNPTDPKVNYVELTSPSDKKYTDQVSYLHDINVIKIDARIDEPGLWNYRIERLGDSHQSHFVQVVADITQEQRKQEMTVRVFSNIDETRVANYSENPLILFADIKKGNAPVLGADVTAFINSGDAQWSTKLHDNGNGNPDITHGDGIYSRYIIPPALIKGGNFDIIVKVVTTPVDSTYFDFGPSTGSYSRKMEPCCGSSLVYNNQFSSLKKAPFFENIFSTFSVRVMDIRASNIYPPSRVGDLRVVAVFDKNVTFQFTSPGEDYDQGQVSTYEFYFGRTREVHTDTAVLFHNTTSTFVAGTKATLTITFEESGTYFVFMLARDPHRLAGLPSNIAQVHISSGLDGDGDAENVPDSGSWPNSKPTSGRLTTGEIAGTVVGAVLLVLLLIALIVLCIFCRRRAHKKDVSTPQTNVFTISEVKEPIHWSASELLQEHEKRLSLYGQSQRSDTQNNSEPTEARDRRNHTKTSPGSSVRSFRSFTDGQHRPTLTDYESCSSDPILKGTVDYDTALDSDTDNLNYRTIDSYVGAMYRANINANINSGFNGGPASPLGGGYSQHTQVQYNSSYRGSLTSVNSSKRRNITMV